MLENLLRNEDDRFVKAADITAVRRRGRRTKKSLSPPPRPHAGLYGVPAIVDLGRDAGRHEKLGGDPRRSIRSFPWTW